MKGSFDFFFILFQNKNEKVFVFEKVSFEVINFFYTVQSV
jgi:hypothetical protein